MRRGLWLMAALAGLAQGWWAPNIVLAQVEPQRHYFPLELHKANYLLTTWDSEPYPDRQDKELKFQVSFKKRLLDDTPLYIAYTQRVNWQWYNKKDSRPFRTQTHNPEVFIESEGDLLFGGLTGIRVGVEHESNGQSTVDSRSWDRAYVQPWITFPKWENLTLAVKGWGRFPESKKKSPDDAAGDDNPDITDYLGHGELHVTQYSIGTGDNLPYRRVALMMRKGTKAGTTTGQLDLDYHLHDVWNFFNEGIFLHVQYFYGYGENLNDYNRLVKKFGIGFSFY